MNTHQNQTDHEDPVHRLLDQATPEALSVPKTLPEPARVLTAEEGAPASVWEVPGSFLQMAAGEQRGLHPPAPHLPSQGAGEKQLPVSPGG